MVGQAMIAEKPGGLEGVVGTSFAGVIICRRPGDEFKEVNALMKSFGVTKKDLGRYGGKYLGLEILGLEEEERYRIVAVGDTLEELTEKCKAKGIVQPLIANPLPTLERYNTLEAEAQEYQSH